MNDYKKILKEEKLINNFYISRLIDSLENEYMMWEKYDWCGSEGSGGTDWNGPAHKNERGEKLSFSIRGSIVAYVNGRIMWQLSPWFLINPFSYKSKRLRKAIRKMKNYTNLKEKAKRIDELKKVL